MPCNQVYLQWFNYLVIHCQKRSMFSNHQEDTGPFAGPAGASRKSQCFLLCRQTHHEGWYSWSCATQQCGQAMAPWLNKLIHTRIHRLESRVWSLQDRTGSYTAFFYQTHDLNLSINLCLITLLCLCRHVSCIYVFVYLQGHLPICWSYLLHLHLRIYFTSTFSFTLLSY